MAKPFLWVFGLGLMLAGRCFAAGAPQPLRVEDLSKRTTAELAAELLSPTDAAGVVLHDISASGAPGSAPLGVQFFLQGRVAGEHICQREAIYVSFAPQAPQDPAALAKRSLAVEARVQSTQIAWSKRCDDKDQPYAAINFPASFDEAARLLRAMAKWQGAPESLALTGNAVSCRAPGNPAACAGPFAKALARVPLDHLAVISREGRSGAWELASGLDHGRVWRVRIEGEIERPTAIALAWEPPPPF